MTTRALASTVGPREPARTWGQPHRLGRRRRREPPAGSRAWVPMAGSPNGSLDVHRHRL